MGRFALLGLVLVACAAFVNGPGGLTDEAANCPSGMQARQGACWPLDAARADAGDDE